MSFTPTGFWNPDPESSRCAPKAIIAKPAAGKSAWVNKTLRDAYDTGKLTGVRTVMILPKEDSIIKGSEPVSDMRSLTKRLKTDDIVVVYPPRGDVNLEGFVDEVINTIMDIHESTGGVIKIDRKTTVPLRFNLVIDDSQVILSNRKEPSSSVKRAVIAFRRVGQIIMIGHRPAFLPRISAGSLSDVIFFNVSSIDDDVSKRVFGTDISGVYDKLGDYRWAHLDVFSGKIDYYNPLSL